jgi:hypothetical protein
MAREQDRHHQGEGDPLKGCDGEQDASKCRLAVERQRQRHDPGGHHHCAGGCWDPLECVVQRAQDRSPACASLDREGELRAAPGWSVARKSNGSSRACPSRIASVTARSNDPSRQRSAWEIRASDAR